MAARKDVQTVRPDGSTVSARIEGVLIREAITHLDERGELAEIFNPDWGLTDFPMVYAYMAGVRPRKVKGWVMHRKQTDRLFPCVGTLRFVLYDARDSSPTFGHIDQFVFGEKRRAMVVIPEGVWHAVQNIGTGDAVFVNLPSLPYDHADPDKYRLPLDTDEIPFHDWDAPGW